MPLTQRFATAVATLPEGAQAPLWRAWSLAPLKQRAVMMRMAERVWGGQGDVEGIPTRNQVKVFAGNLLERTKQVEVELEKLRAIYAALCKPWDEVWSEAFERFRSETNRAMQDRFGTEIPLTAAEHAAIWKMAHEIEPELGFDTPSKTPCVGEDFDLRIRAFFHSWDDKRGGLRTRIIAWGVGAGPQSAQAEATLKRELEAFNQNIGLWLKRAQRKAREIADKFPRPGKGLPGIPDVGLILLLAALGLVVLTR